MKPRLFALVASIFATSAAHDGGYTCGVDVNDSSATTTTTTTVCPQFLTMACRISGTGDRPAFERDELTARAVHGCVRALERSQACFRLHVYTNAPTLLERLERLSPSLVAHTMPDLPANYYDLDPSFFVTEGESQPHRQVYTSESDVGRIVPTDARNWRSLSRAKLDLIEWHERGERRRVIWLDVDTLVVGRMDRIYAAVVAATHGNFFVFTDRVMRQVDGRWTARYCHGDMFMIDALLASRVRALERKMYPRLPQYDLQDYVTIVAEQDASAVTSLRALERRINDEDGAQLPQPRCYGFEYIEGGRFDDRDARRLLEVDADDGTLVCKSDDRGRVGVGSISFTGPTYASMLDAPRRYWSRVDYRVLEWLERCALP